jgi:hypothetical protein
MSQSNAASINQQVNYGFAQAAINLGFPYQWYRPAAGTAALAAGNLMGNVTAYITTDASLKSSVPPQDAKPTWYGAYDTTNTKPGDYFVGALGTFFIASEFLPSPPSLVFCNTVASVLRPTKPAPGPAFAFGDAGAPNVYAEQFPCWIKAAERRSTPELHLPGSIELPSANILLPQSITLEILRGDVITETDAGGTAWTVQSADLLFNCWNIVAVKTGA